MKTIFKISTILGILLCIAGLHTFGQVRIATDDYPPHPSAMLDVDDTATGILIPRMTETQRNSISSPATGLMLYQTDEPSGFYYNDGTTWTRIGEHSTHYIGKAYQGGIIFWLDETGEHGLIVSMIDLSTSQIWSNVSTTLIGGPAQSDWNGLVNSNAIISQRRAASQ